MSAEHPTLAAQTAAMALAAQGFSVFPCSGAKKRPCLPGGFHSAVRVADDAGRLFQRYAGELVGVPTGPVNGFDVLDIDPRHGGDEWENQNAAHLPRTRIHSTRSGGRHYLFQHHPGIRNTESKLAPGVDTRGEGGYVIWWPAHGCTMNCEASPAEWPAWLLALLLPKPAPVIAPVRAMVLRSDTQARRLLQRCLDRVARASSGQRHYALRSAAYTIGGLLGPDVGEGEATRYLLDAVRNAGGADVDEKNALATIVSGLRKGAAAPLARCA